MIIASPRATLAFIGHHKAEQAFVEAWNQQRVHHAWLLAGPRGVGKASFAWRVARFLLSTEPKGEEGLFGCTQPESLALSADDPVYARIASGGIAGLAVLERQANEKTGKFAANIGVEQVRALVPALGVQADPEAWRVVIIDAIDDLNRAAANALLKMLEEPPPRTVFLLVSHQPGRLLATIKSRCRRLEFQPLSSAEVMNVLRVHGFDDPLLAQLADGAPGRALGYAGLDLAPLNQVIATGLSGQLGLADRLALAEELGKGDAQPRFEAFLDLVQRAINTRLKERVRRGERVDVRLMLWDKACEIAGPALTLNDDPKLITLSLLGLLAQV